MIFIGSYSAIGDTGKTIINVLREKMTPEPIPKPEMIELCSPVDAGEFRLTLYLYSVTENGEARSLGISQDPKVSLSLFYLLTAFSNADVKSRAYDESCIIGKAIQVLNENAVIRGSYLQGTLAENNESIRIVQNNISTDEMSKIWNFPNLTYKLSVSFMVGPVYIDSVSENTAARVMK